MTEKPLHQPGDPGDRVEVAVAAFREALRKIRYGTIAVTVHDARVVQFDITEKRRIAP